MGQQSTGMGRIHQLSESLTLVRTQPGEKIYLNRQTEEEYLLITRLAQPQDDFENTLAKRRELKCCYLPQLIGTPPSMQTTASRRKDTAVTPQWLISSSDTQPSHWPRNRSTGPQWGSASRRENSSWSATAPSRHSSSTPRWGTTTNLASMSRPSSLRWTARLY